MQNAETVTEILRARGRRGLPCNELYRQLFNPALFLMAWGRIYANKGAMTAGINAETADGMSLAKIGRIINALRHERYRFQPVKRVHIPKKSGGTRPLGLPSWSDKLLGEVVRILLEAYYEPRFSASSHGFRPGRGCHTALAEVEETWKGTTWFIEGDIRDCFGTLDHDVMIAVLAEHICDNRFLRLIRGMLRAGFLEDWRWNATLSGAPQGGVVSPILSNIYLDRMDKFAETVLIPEHTRGTGRKPNPARKKMANAMTAARKRGDRAAVRDLRVRARGMPSRDPHDPGYRRLRYIRYADDHLLGFTGPKAEAEQIRDMLAAFLRRELRLELSADKTLITHGRTQKARFLGYDIIVQHSPSRPRVNGRIGLRVPPDVVTAKQAPYRRHGTPWHRPHLLNMDDLQIISIYGAEYRGIVQYYLLAGNVFRLHRLRRAAELSMLKTLAAKHRSTVAKTARKYRAVAVTPHGPRTCFEARLERPGRKPLAARFGGIPLKRQRKTVITDRQQAPPARPKEIITRLLHGECERCHTRTQVETHQVRKLADLASQPGREQPAWAAQMAKMRRKTLIVCARCHQAIHHGKPAANCT
jgi:group II intron reverse transcriptase/maturase